MNWQRTLLVPRSNLRDLHSRWRRQDLPLGRFRKNLPAERGRVGSGGRRCRTGKIGRELAQQTDIADVGPKGSAGQRRIELFGFLWLFAIGAVWLVRLLLDPTMVRRPLLEPNLTTGGLIFIGASLFVFLMANVWTSQRFQAMPRLAQARVESMSAEERPRGRPDRLAKACGAGRAMHC